MPVGMDAKVFVSVARVAVKTFKGAILRLRPPLSVGLSGAGVSQA